MECAGNKEAGHYGEEDRNSLGQHRISTDENQSRRCADKDADQRVVSHRIRHPFRRVERPRLHRQPRQELHGEQKGGTFIFHWIS